MLFYMDRYPSEPLAEYVTPLEAKLLSLPILVDVPTPIRKVCQNTLRFVLSDSKMYSPLTSSKPKRKRIIL